MAQASAPCKGCGTDIPRTRPTGPIPHYCSPDCRPRCGVEGCGEPVHGATYCAAHHTRWKKYGDPEAPLVRRPNEGECSVEGCTQPMRKTGWCAGHYSQWVRTGEAPKPFTFKWGSGGYVSSHSRLARALGPASAQFCVDCSNPAAEWSYRHGDPDELVDARGVVYSRKFEFYEPRCALCHRRFDRARRRVNP